jgi:pimeloyl-ACP methyl ester carboxylesterase
LIDTFSRHSITYVPNPMGAQLHAGCHRRNIQRVAAQSSIPVLKATKLPVYHDYPYQGHFFRIGEHRLHYLDEGQGPCIVMVHGNPTWSYYFRHLVATLRGTHRVIALDHLGCGLSDKPGDYPYSLKKHIDNLESLLEYLRIDNCSLVVHDWGGAIGFGYAVRHPQRIKRIALMNTAAFRSPRMPWRIRVCRLPVLGEILVRLCNGFAWPATFMAVSKVMSREVKASYLRPYNSWHNRVAIAAFVKDIPMTRDHRSYATLEAIEQGLEKLRRLGIPLFILWGGKDFCFNDSFYEEWRQRFPKAQYRYFADAGHYLLEDKGEEILPLLSRFFAPKEMVSMEQEA